MRASDSGSKQPSLAYIRLANFYRTYMCIVLTGKLRTTPPAAQTKTGFTCYRKGSCAVKSQYLQCSATVECKHK